MMQESDYISLAAMVSRTRSEGPGERFALWVQGCSIRCPGCCNPEMQPFSGGHSYTMGELLQKIVDAEVEGVSILGGEPFDQAQSLGVLARELQKRDIGIVVFSGYEMDEIEAREEFQLLFQHTDLLKTGPYIQSRRSRKIRWMGSENQRFHFLTDRYRNHPDIRQNYTQSITLDLSEGEINASGWPDFIP